ncbi:FAD binding domain-containing protein [Stappia sp.]|uniref:FAD binding domain-containing protein n=1 Tax=Stappia sp. TaxID=1870903 RepID=UPI003D148E8B
MQFHRPDTVDVALSLLGGGEARVLAGGTDFFPALGGRRPSAPVVDLGRIAALRGISRQEDGWRIGAMTTWTDIARADLPPLFDGLRLAAREVGSIQIQNAGTIAGNLCNASPAADGVPPLLTLDARVELVGPKGTRELPLGDFILGVRKTALAPGEIVTAILVPDWNADRTHFLKLGARRYLVISIAMVAAAVLLDGAGRIGEARVAVGACSAVARRLAGVEAALRGAEASGPAIRQQVADAAIAELSPIDDVRASAGYRLDAARELVVRAVMAAIDRGGKAWR